MVRGGGGASARRSCQDGAAHVARPPWWCVDVSAGGARDGSRLGRRPFSNGSFLGLLLVLGVLLFSFDGGRGHGG